MIRWLLSWNDPETFVNGKTRAYRELWAKYGGKPIRRRHRSLYRFGMLHFLAWLRVILRWGSSQAP